jgi:hypothetical protein
MSVVLLLYERRMVQIVECVDATQLQMRLLDLPLNTLAILC